MAVMESAGENFERIAIDSIDESILLIDASAPKTLQVAPEWFGFSHTGVSISTNVVDQCVDSLERLSILCLPIGVITPCVLSENLAH